MKDSISDSVAPIDPSTTSTNRWWLSPKEIQVLFNGPKWNIEFPPEPTWTCELYGTGKEQVWYTSRAPNWFWRLMQRLILGNRWRKL